MYCLPSTMKVEGGVEEVLEGELHLARNGAAATPDGSGMAAASMMSTERRIKTGT